MREQILHTVLFSFKRKKHKKANCYAYIKNNIVAIVKLSDNKKDKIVLTVLKSNFKNGWWNSKKRGEKRC